ncbi:acetate/propionate family kinase [Mycoplasmopsis primatum]|uniref:acetate/propionate family kinase n=1 Tax=Mycoplasmopsis primatum TaxID=55604 RepID=UPI000494E2CF|nr:acetate/propionate family kinase [Mycoplasmopsis primatum]
MKKILVINAGSSSLKWAFYSENKLELLYSGLCERIGLDGNIILKRNDEKLEFPIALPDHGTAVENLIRLWKENKFIDDLNEISAIGFRIPFSGYKYLTPVVYSQEVRESIETAKKFIPLHVPPFLSAIDAFNKYLPKIVKIVAQDTAFHVDMPKINKTFPINKEWAKKFNVEKFGYHGLSHDYINEKMKQILGKNRVNIVVAHLGSGSSLCAIKNGKSIDVSVGFSSIDGLMMGTRSGAIDPGITDYLIRIEHQDPQDVFDMLVKKSGLLGISGISNDIRDLHNLYEKDENAKFAVDLFVSKIVDYLAMYLNKIGKEPDAIVFTAGIGENDPIIRQMVVDGINSYNLKISPKLNEAKYDDYVKISSDSSDIPVYKMKTNEEIVIARYVKKILSKLNK